LLKDSWKINGLIAALSGAVWVISVVAHNHFLGFLAHAPGIDMLFLPSGMRLIALMIGGGWAAAGISAGSLLLTGAEFHTMNAGVILAIAACGGFCPYAALRLSMRLVGVEPGLANLQAGHLPFIGLGVAVGSSILHNLLFSAMGLEPWRSFGDHLLAMTAGDFLGIMLAVVIVFVFLRLVRRPRP
jgi:hypothetical protein